MMFFFDTDCYNVNQVPFSYPGDRIDMARILAGLTLLLVGANACTTHIINSVWGKMKVHDLPSAAPKEISP